MAYPSLPGKLHLLLRPGRRSVQAIRVKCEWKSNSIRTTCAPASADEILSDLAQRPNIVPSNHAAVRCTPLDISIDSFLFADTAHKTISLDDWPGAAGPAPGSPLTQAPEPVARLASQNSVAM